MLRIRTDLSAETVTVELHGEFDAHTTPAFEQGSAPFRSHLGLVVVDLSGVGVVDSSAIGAMLRLARDVGEAGGRLCVKSSNMSHHRLLRITGVDELLNTESLPDPA